MRRHFATVCLAAALLAVLAGCATQQPMRANEPGSRPVAGTDEDELWYAMEKAEEDLRRSPMRVRDPALNAYVTDVACRASAGYCKDLRVYIMNVPAFNASMAPNGTMIVWTGALLRMRDEAELAFVLGHEAGHFRAQHTLRQWRRMKDTSAFLSAFQVLAYGAGFPNTAMLGSLGIYATIFKFSRDMEREADKLGFEAVVAQGWDPRAGADVWGRMLREENTLKYISQQHGVRLAPGDRGTPRRRARRRRHGAESAEHAQQGAIPRSDAALPRELAGRRTRAAPLREFATGDPGTARRRPAGRQGHADVLSRRGVSPPR